jgi:hypothetical protein
LNLSLEFATLVRRPQSEGRFLIWAANGPAACELDLWAPVTGRDGGESRPLCDLLLRRLAHLLADPPSEVAFVPRMEPSEMPWQVGIRFERLDAVEAHPPSARVDTVGGERVQSGDPAFRLVFTSGADSLTLRSDRAGIQELERHCRDASRTRRTA